MTNHKASLIVGHVFHLAEILPCFNGESLVATPQCNNNEGRYYSRGRSSVPPKILLMKSLSFCRGSRVEGSMSRVEGNIFFSKFFF